MVKTKNDVQKILKKINGEYRTAKEFGEACQLEEDVRYFLGKMKALRDVETWIQENIKEES